jgi:signal transduction histidine kinase
LIRFASGVAHDFNNLLTVINGYSELLLAGGPAPALCERYVQEILRAGMKAAEVVELILAYAGAPTLSPEIIDVNLMVEGMRGFLAVYLGESISLDLALCPEPAWVRADRGKLQWALTHLFINAREAMPDGGSVECATRILPACETEGLPADPPGPRVGISVRDTGRGMTKEELQRIFEPYYSTKRCANAHGMGLGLSCAQGIIRQAGGCIRAESESGKGSVFRICLPFREHGL